MEIKRKMMMMSKFIGAGMGLSILLGLPACNVINPEEDIPAYIYVPDIELQTNSTSEGTNSERITDVWLSVDGGFLGAYTLPALIPVLETGAREITLQAGIKDNGINSSPDIYPFYEPFIYERTLTPTEVDTVRPLIGYQDGVQFSFIENFERSAHIFQDVRRGAASQMSLATEGAFEGSQSLRIRLDTSNAILEVATNGRFGELTKQSPFVYLEVNYRSDVPVVFGVIGHEVNGLPSQGIAAFDPGFSPRQDWNKIYFNLSRLINQVNREQYQVVLQAYIPIEGGQLSRQSAEIWLDNIKLVHF